MAGPQDKYEEFRQDLDLIGHLIEQLKREYDMYFAGMLKKQPFELKHKLETLLRKHRASNVHKLELTFRYNSLQSKYNKYTELWGKIFKRREIDPHARSAYGPTREQLADEMSNLNRGRREVAEAEAQNAGRKKPGDEMRDVFDQYLDAKKELGETVENLRYDKFKAQLQKQMQGIKDKTGGADVQFKVTRKNGKVSLTAKVVKD